MFLVHVDITYMAQGPYLVYLSITARVLVGSMYNNLQFYLDLGNNPMLPFEH